MNHSFNNDVKFTGSAFEYPADAVTILLQWVFLVMIMIGVGFEDRRN